MVRLLQLLALHLVVLVMGYGCIATLRGDEAERNYRAFGRFLFPGRFKSDWLALQRIAAWFGLPLLFLVYVGALLGILRG